MIMGNVTIPPLNLFQLLDYFLNFHIFWICSMVVSQQILSDKQGQPRSHNAALGSKFAFEISPDSFQSFYMVSFYIPEFFFSAILQTMNISLYSDASLCFPGFRTDRLTPFHLFGDQQEKSGLVQRMPKTGCFDVPRPCLVQISRIIFRLFFHAPPKWDSLTSTVQGKMSGMCFARNIRIF